MDFLAKVRGWTQRYVTPVLDAGRERFGQIAARVQGRGDLDAPAPVRGAQPAGGDITLAGARPAPSAGSGPGRLASGALEPGERIYAVGDIHGRADLLEKLLQRIEADAADLSRPAMLVFLGDYVDRGFQSRQVIDLILSERLTRFEVQCIKGNHEAAMLTFLRDPQFGPRWASYGGRETLVSYGVRPPRNVTKLDEWEAAHQEFVRVLPAAHETFLQRLPTSLRVGPYGFVHAGVKPGVPFEDQTEADLLWIREEFLRSSQPNDLVIVHGHTPVDRPHRDDRRINVDTGAYFSGRLTAVRLEADTIGFLSTEV